MSAPTRSPRPYGQSVLVGIILLCLVGLILLLIAWNYRSSSQLQAAYLEQLAADTQREADRLEFTLSETVTDLQSIAYGRELRAFYENRALGMSMEYGLNLSLEALRSQMRDRMAETAHSTPHGYLRMLLLDENAVVLVQLGTDLPGSGNTQQLGRLLATHRPDANFTHEPNEGSLRITLPCRFKEQKSGVLVAWVSLSGLFRSTPRNEGLHAQVMALEIGANQRVGAQPLAPLFSADNVSSWEIPLRKATRVSSEVAGTERDFAVVRVPFGTLRSLAVFSAYDVSESQSALSPLRLMATMVGLALTILLGAIYIYHQNTRAALLQVTLEESRRRKEEIEQHNRELAEAGERARELARQAEAANRAKSQFLANMSHEIRTPMNGVLGMLSLLYTTEMDETQMSYAGAIKSSGEALLTIINDILDFSKMEAGKLSIEQVEFCLRPLMERIAPPLTLRAREKNLRFSFHTAAGVPDRFIGDPMRLRQIITNLASNALKFTSDGEVSIVVSLAAPLTTTDALLRVTVKDTGIGIPKDKTDCLFKPFSQVDTSNTRTYGGTGLGLAISHQLVSLMGGRIGVESNENVGSLFWFELPLTRTYEEAPPPAQVTEHGRLPEIPSQGRTGGNSAGAQVRDAAPYLQPAREASVGRGAQRGASIAVGTEDALPEPRLLLVEDQAVNQLVMLGMLSNMGYHAVEYVNSSPAALEAIAGGNFDLVVLDLELPDFDGMEFCRTLRRGQAGDRGRNIPVVALASAGMVADQTQCLEAGINDCIAKPVLPEDLQRVLAAQLPLYRCW